MLKYKALTTEWRVGGSVMVNTTLLYCVVCMRVYYRTCIFVFAPLRHSRRSASHRLLISSRHPPYLGVPQGILILPGLKVLRDSLLDRPLTRVLGSWRPLIRRIMSTLLFVLPSQQRVQMFIQFQEYSFQYTNSLKTNQIINIITFQNYSEEKNCPYIITNVLGNM